MVAALLAGDGCDQTAVVEKQTVYDVATIVVQRC